jgi:cell division protein FtsI (penicillin-binding protein 3)
VTTKTRTRQQRPSRLALGSFGRSGENFKRKPKTEKKKRIKIDPRAAVSIRIRVIAGAFAIGVLVLLARAWQLQIVSGHRYDDAARRQALTSARITAKRGVIKDRNGSELAISVDVDSIFAEPRLIADARTAAKTLAPLLGTTQAKLERRLKTDRPFVFLKRRVGPQIADKVRALAIPGIGAQPEPQRFYPTRELGAHVIGFTDSEGEGRAGIERMFDEALRGKSYEVPGLRDALGNKAFVDGFVPQAVLEGDDVILTIDRTIQHAAQVELAKTVVDNEAQAGVAIVMRPENGEILALASYPDFNPNNLTGTNTGQHLNRAVAAVFEPGSTLKMVTIAAALEESLIEPSTKIDCENGRWQVGGRTIGDAQHKYGVLTIPEVMKHSSNICAAKIGFLLGSEKLHGWLSRFGFGAKTGIELPGELDGLLRPGHSWREIELANVSFGQGLSVTPLQVVRAAAAIANGGLLVEPHLLKGTIDKGGNEKPYEPKAPQRVIGSATARRLTEMMVEVTEKGGTAEAAAIPGFSVAGKTGTAQKIDPVTRAYSRSLYVASFVGFAPADRPEVVVLVLIDEPKKSIYGGLVAAPAFKAIASASLSALSVFPEDSEAREAFLASYRAEALPVAELAEAVVAPVKHLDRVISSKDRAVLEEPADGRLSPGEADAVLPDWTKDAQGAGGRGRMPNFSGLGPHEVLNRSAEVHCDLVLKGTGRVVRQSPRAGAALEPGQRCELELSPSG